MNVLISSPSFMTTFLMVISHGSANEPRDYLMVVREADLDSKGKP